MQVWSVCKDISRKEIVWTSGMVLTFEIVLHFGIVRTWGHGFTREDLFKIIVRIDVSYIE